MRISIIVSADDNIKRKIQYGFSLLFQPLRVELNFAKTLSPDCPNIFYGRQMPNDSKKVLWIRSSDQFRTCISGSTLPETESIPRFEYAGKVLPKIFAVANPLNPSIDFDIPAAAFILASDFQDLISLERDEFDRLRAMDSLQYKLGILEFPAVNYYSRLLKERVEEYFGITLDRKMYASTDSAIALTHDVDFVSFLNPKMISREMVGIAVLNRHGLPSKQRATKLLFPLYALFGFDLPKIGLKFIFNAENSLGLKSTFFIKTGTTGKQDIPYNFRSKTMRNFLNMLAAEGFEIGIHPSMGTYVDVDEFVREKNRLQDFIGKRVNSVRQHYLKFTAGRTVQIWEKAEMKYDSTLGFSREIGFRNSVAFPYPLYNFAEDRPSTVIELPLVFMDGTLAENKTISNDQALTRMKELIKETRMANGTASILFHNSLTDPIDFQGYTEIFTAVLQEIKGNGMTAGTLASVADNLA